MNRKTAIKIGLIVGSTVGSYIPSLWGDGIFSFSSILCSALFASIGVYAGYKLGY